MAAELIRFGTPLAAIVARRTSFIVGRLVMQAHGLTSCGSLGGNIRRRQPATHLPGGQWWSAAVAKVRAMERPCSHCSGGLEGLGAHAGMGGLLHLPARAVCLLLLPAGCKSREPHKEPHLRRRVNILIQIFSHSRLTTFFSRLRSPARRVLYPVRHCVRVLAFPSPQPHLGLSAASSPTTPPHLSTSPSILRPQVRTPHSIHVLTFDPVQAEPITYSDASPLTVLPLTLGRQALAQCQ
jgi:hypothetical protein